MPFKRSALLLAAGVVLALALLTLSRRACAPDVQKLAPISAPNPPSKAALPPGPERTAYAPLDIRPAIRDGKRLLAASHLDSSKCGARPVFKTVGKGRKRHTVRIEVAGPKRCLGDYLLAAVNATGSITVVEAYEGRPSFPAGFTVTLEAGGKRKGVNVPFAVKSPPGWTVVALRTAVYEGKDVGGGVYVPYSTALDVPELREDGLRYLERIADDALADLRGRGVQSRFFKGQLVSDTVDLQHLVTLVLTEQMKSDVLFERGSEAERVAMVNRTLVILGANREDACQFTRSRTGASGIAQLMPGTYRRLRRAYPKAGLPEDLDARLDHAQAMKAMVLHADDEWWAVSGDVAYRDWLRSHHDARRLMLAAGYNANVGNVVKAIKACGERWRDPACHALPEETRRYLVKYEAVWNLLYDQTMASPMMADAGTR